MDRFVVSFVFGFVCRGMACVVRFLPLVTRGILGACIGTKQYVLLRLVSDVLLCFSKSEKMIQTLKNHFGELIAI